jgi:DNA-binding transcriptional MerR regulator
MGDRDAAAGAQQPTELLEAIRRALPEHDRVDGEHLVERRVEDGQVLDGTQPESDASGPDGRGVAPPCLVQHPLGVVETADVPVDRDVTQLANGEARSESDLQDTLTRTPHSTNLHVEAHFKSRGRMSGRNGLVAIGELARRTGLASSALRYYERVGLLSPSARAGGRRHYDASGIERVALIQLCQDAGFTLREIRALLAAGSGRGRSWRRLAEGKVQELETRIARAERAKALIQHALACPHRSLVTCPNFRAALGARFEEKGSDPVGKAPAGRAGGRDVPDRLGAKSAMRGI